MSTSSTPLAMNSYFTKWKGGYKSWKDDPNDSKITPEKINQPNTCAAPKGSAAGIAFNQVPSDYLATHFPYNATTPNGWYPKHRPLKIWRRSYSTTSGKLPLGTMDRPGGTIFKNDQCREGKTQPIIDQTKIAYKKAELEKQYTDPITVKEKLDEYIKEITKQGGCGVTIVSDYLTKENKNTTCCRPTAYDMNGNVESTTNFAKQRAQLVRNGSTNGTKYCNEDKKYYTTTSAYLKSRCTNYATKAMTSRPAFSAARNEKGVIIGFINSKGELVTDLNSVDLNKYITNCSYSENEEIIDWLNYKLAMLNIDNPPSSSPYTPSVEQSKVHALLNEVKNKKKQCCVNTIYKPCNTKFSTNTAVSSSSRIARLKYDTVTKSAQNQRHVWGPEAASASAYSGRPEAPFVTKGKFSPCVPHRIAGTKTSCFYVDPSKKHQGLVLSDGKTYK